MIGTYRYLADLNLGFLVVSGCDYEGFLLLLPPLCDQIVLAQIQIGGEIYDGYLESGLCFGRRLSSSVDGPAKNSAPPIPASTSCHLGWWTYGRCLRLDNRGGRGIFDLFDRLNDRSVITLVG